MYTEKVNLHTCGESLSVSNFIQLLYDIEGSDTNKRELKEP
jgi:hypothetical protein